MPKILLLLSIACASLSFGQEFEWAKYLAGQGQSNIQNLAEGSSRCYGLAVDPAENVYITGICNDSVDFDPGTDTSFVIAGQNDIYIAKYDPSGALIWRNVLISNSMNFVNGIEVDVEGNILIIGLVVDSVDFDPSVASHMVTSTTGEAGKMILAKYDSNGNFLWVKSVGGSFAPWGNDLTTDSLGQIYVTGSFYDSLDFDPGPSQFNLTSNGLAMYFSKYTPDGDLIWAKHIPNCNSYGEATDIDLANDGTIYISGLFGNTVDFDPGPSSYIITSETTSDRYFAKYTNDGDFIWARNINVNDNGGIISGRNVQMAIDSENNLYLTGDFKSNADFDPGPGIFTMTCTNGYGTYISKFDPAGMFQWAKMIAGSYCVATDITTDCEDNINITGMFSYADFDPGPNNFDLFISSNTGSMNFFAEYDSDGNFLWVKAIGNNGQGGGPVPSGLFVKEDTQYIFGAFKQTGDFNPDPDEEHLLTSSGVGFNAYFAKYTGEWSDESDTLFNCDYAPLVLLPDHNGNNLIWQNGETDTSITVTDPGIYWASQEFKGCKKIDSFLIINTECGTSSVSMPNVFSPNDDHTNDFFFPSEHYNINKYNLSILNRWGQLLYSSNSISEGWDGRSNGINCVEGTYFWKIEYSDHNNQKKMESGFLELVR